MDGWERIIDVAIRQAREVFAKHRIVALLSWRESHILQQHDAMQWELGALHLEQIPLGYKANRFLHEFSEMPCYWCEGELRVKLPGFWAAELRDEHQLCRALLEQVLECGEALANT